MRKRERKSLSRGACNVIQWKRGVNTRLDPISMVCLVAKLDNNQDLVIQMPIKLKALHGAKTLFGSTLKIPRNTSQGLRWCLQDSRRNKNVLTLLLSWKQTQNKMFLNSTQT